MRRTSGAAAAARLDLALAVALALALAAPATGAATGSLKVGALELTACGVQGAYCGALERPLDPTGRVPGTIAVHFEYYPMLDGPRQGTLVATEGGPGYPATDSRAAYLALFGPLRAGRDLVLMDNRGTGQSGAIDCPRLQREDALAVEAIGECGRQLGARAPFYGTAYAADDLEAILTALGSGAIDLYGDSYGTFFAQVFAVRHGDRLRSLVLDGAYPIVGTERSWYPDYAPAMRTKFNLACARSPRCSSVPGSSLEHLAPALEALRARPFQARGIDVDGIERRYTASAGVLATVLFGAAPPYATLREADAAARAFHGGDRAPLVRLMAEALAATDSRDPSRDPARFSAGLAAAVSCQDGPQILDMRLPPVERRAAYEQLLGERRRTHPDSFAPFTIDEYRAMPVDYAYLDQCRDWPAADPRHPAAQPVPPEATFPDIPVLVLSADLDDITSVAEGRAAAAQFRRARQVVIANGFHVNALPHARSSCSRDLVRAFIAAAEPAVEEALAATCAAGPPPVRLAAPFRRSYRHAEPAEAAHGNQAGLDALTLAGAALATLGDVLPRIAANSSGHGVGLRGGRFTLTTNPDGTRTATLSRYRWADDLAISGRLEWRPNQGLARAVIGLAAAHGPHGKLVVSWDEGQRDARARIEGRIRRQALVAEAPAP